MTKKSLYTLGLGLLFASILPLQALAAAESSDGGRHIEEGEFSYGGECSQLSQLAHRSILALVHEVHAENFANFCSAEGIYSCDDYTPLLGGAGTLEINGSLGCRFIPNH